MTGHRCLVCRTPHASQAAAQQCCPDGSDDPDDSDTPVIAVTDGGSAYVNPTGPGYHTTRTIGTTGATVPLAGTGLDWSPGDTVYADARPAAVAVVSHREPTEKRVATLTVTTPDQTRRRINLPTRVLSTIGLDEDDQYRVYLDGESLLLVDPDADPRLAGPQKRRPDGASTEIEGGDSG